MARESSPYKDAMRCYKDENRLKRVASSSKEIQPGVHLGQQVLVFDEIRNVTGTSDYRELLKLFDQALKERSNPTRAEA